MVSPSQRCAEMVFRQLKSVCLNLWELLIRASQQKGEQDSVFYLLCNTSGTSFGSWEHWIYSALSFCGDEQDQKPEASYIQKPIPCFTHHKQIQTKQASPISFPVGQCTYGTCMFLGQFKPKSIAQDLLQRIKMNKCYFLMGKRKSMSVLTCEEIFSSECS